MRLQPAAFNRLIGHLGQACLWSRAELCPCRDTYSGAAEPNCPACSGRGVFWRGAVRATTGLTSMRVAREWQHFGMWESGDVVLSVPSDSPLYDAGENDRVALVNSTEPYTSTFVRGAEDERWPAYLTEVEAVTVRQGEGVASRAVPVLPADRSAPFRPAWPEAGGPAEGEQYAIRGRRHPVFFVFKSLPQDRAHHSGATLPRKIAARRFDLFGR